MVNHTTFDGLNAKNFQPGLRTQAIGRRAHVLAEAPSTNTLAFTLAESGEPHGTVVLAENQTAGRGRLGRSWHSPPYKNIYCSVLIIDPRLEQHLTWIPLVTGLAISEALKQVVSVKPTLKWPTP